MNPREGLRIIRSLPDRLRGEPTDPNVSPRNIIAHSYIESIDGPLVSAHNRVATPKLFGIFPFGESSEPFEKPQ